MSLLPLRLQGMEVARKMGIFESRDAISNKKEADNNADQDGPSHSVSEVTGFKAVVAELAELKTNIARYLEDAR